MWTALAVIALAIEAGAIVYLAIQLRTATAKATELSVKFDTFSLLWEGHAKEWQAERSSLLAAMERQRDDYSATLDSLHRALTGDGVPPRVAGEYAQRVLATGPRDANPGPRRDAPPMPPITRPPARTTPGKGGG